MQKNLHTVGNVGIITRTRNNPLLLWRAMESVLEQTHVDWTHVVINDGGEPEPVERLAGRYRERYGERLVVVHRRKPSAPEAALNQGLEALKGADYIVLHDDDDNWDPAFLEKSIEALCTQQRIVPNMRGIMCWCLHVSEHLEGERIFEDAVEPYNDEVSCVKLQNLLVKDFMPAICCLFERSAIDDLGLFDETLPHFGFRDFALRFLVRHEIGVLTKSLAYYRQCKPVPECTPTLYPPINEKDLCEAVFCNELLRRDLRIGKFGIGSLLALIVGVEAGQQPRCGGAANDMSAAEPFRLKKIFQKFSRLFAGR